MDADLVVPRDLTEDETSELREMMNLLFVDINSSADEVEDAESLIEYAVDMIESGENIGHVMGELVFMEMALCDEDVAEELGALMTKFFLELDIDENKAKKEEPATPPRAKEAAPTSPPPRALSPNVEAPTPPPQSNAADDDPVGIDASETTTTTTTLTPMEERELEKKREKEQKEHRARKEANEMTSLKQRMAAYAGSAGEQGNVNVGSSSPRARCPAPANNHPPVEKKSPEKKKASPEKREPSRTAQPSQRKKRISLKERKAAAQRAYSNKLLQQEEENEEPGDEKQIGCAAAGGYPAAAVPPAVEEPPERAAPREEPKKQTTTQNQISLKERLAAFESASADNLQDEGSSAASRNVGRLQRERTVADVRTTGDDPSAETTTTTPRKEPRPRRDGGASLKQRLAAYSSAATTTSGEAGEFSPPAARTALEEGEGLEEDEKDVADDAQPPVPLSLKERMAAFQGGKSPAAAGEDDEGDEGEEDAEGEEELDTSKMTLKDRMAAYQRGAPSSTSADEEDAEGAAADAPSKAKSPPPEEKKKKKKNALGDRMAVFGHAAASEPKQPPPKKELTGVRQRMAAFSNGSNKATAGDPSSSDAADEDAKHKPPPVAQRPSMGGGRGLKDRMAKYAETAGLAETETFAVAAHNKKDKPEKPKPKSFAPPKKVKGDLQSRMQKFQGGGEEERSEEEKNPAASPVSASQKKWKYQKNGSGASQPTAATEKSRTAVVSPGPSEPPPPFDLKARLEAYRANATHSAANNDGEGSVQKEAPDPGVDAGGPSEEKDVRPASEDVHEVGAGGMSKEVGVPGSETLEPPLAADDPPPVEAQTQSPQDDASGKERNEQPEVAGDLASAPEN